MAYERLNRALERLDNKIKEFPIGAITIDDFMPLEDKIKKLKTILKEMDARILNLSATIKKIPKLPEEEEEEEEDINETSKKLSEATSNQIINENAVTLCLEADVIEEMMIYSSQDQEELTLMPRQLYSLNDEGLLLHKTMNELMQKQLYLKIEAQKVAQGHHEFLQQQEELRLQKLQKSNPELAQYKQKMERSIHKINVMKRLIVSFIASSGSLLKQEPILLEMLEKHRDIVTFETISNMVQTDDSN